MCCRASGLRFPLPANPPSLLGLSGLALVALSSPLPSSSHHRHRHICPKMDPSGQYRLYQSPPQLPSPSQLQLPSPASFSRTNNLPPLSNGRYPPPSFPPHPSLNGNSLPPISPPLNGWHQQQQQQQQQHHHQQQQQQQSQQQHSHHVQPRSASTSSYVDRDRERESYPPHPPRPRRDSSSSSIKRESVNVAPAPPHHSRDDHPSAQPEDGMSTTSDFVKKLFK